MAYYPVYFTSPQEEAETLNSVMYCKHVCVYRCTYTCTHTYTHVHAHAHTHAQPHHHHWEDESSYSQEQTDNLVGHGVLCIWKHPERGQIKNKKMS